MKKFLAISLFSFGLMANASEQLPIIQTKYNADPAPMVQVQP